MKKIIVNSLGLLLVLTVLLGLVYPLSVTFLAQVLFPWQANGSLAVKGQETVGSLLIGQSFTDTRYFHGRPSTAGENGYDAAASSGSNLGPTNKELLQQISSQAVKVRSDNNLPAGTLVPGDLVTASGSGLDPHISVAAAQIQVKRVAKARRVDTKTVENLVRKNTEGPQFDLLGEPRVNLLKLNISLDNYN